MNCFNICPTERRRTRLRRRNGPSNAQDAHLCISRHDGNCHALLAGMHASHLLYHRCALSFTIMAPAAALVTAISRSSAPSATFYQIPNQNTVYRHNEYLPASGQDSFSSGKEGNNRRCDSRHQGRSWTGCDKRQRRFGHRSGREKDTRTKF